MTDRPAQDGFRYTRPWLLGVGALVVVQFMLVARLFDPHADPAALFDDRPVTSGRHPLHMYHGLIGAACWAERGTGTCFDPAFQAGLPKTPVFDGRSRFAEAAFITLGPRPRSYKLMLLFVALAPPLLGAIAGRGAGMCAGTSTLAGFLALAVAWSPPFRERLVGGQIDLYLGAFVLPAHLAWVGRFIRHQTPGAWIGLTLLATLAWFCDPVTSLALVPAIVARYLWSCGMRGMNWNCAFWGSAVVALGLNSFWIWDLFRYSWLFVPGSGPADDWIDPVMIPAVFSDLIPADPLAYATGALGLVGAVGWLTRQRATAVLGWFGLCTGLFIGCVGRNWPPLKELGAEQMPALLVAWGVAPAAWLLGRLARQLGGAIGSRSLGGVWLAVGVGGVAASLGGPARWIAPPGFQVGLQPDQVALIDFIKAETPPAGRILWEDVPGGSGWSALLPIWTNRNYLGGLDSDAAIEHMHARLVNGKLADIFFGQWSSEKFAEFAARYDLRAAVVVTPESANRLRGQPGWREVAHFGNATVFKADRAGNFFLKGSGRVVQLDWQRVALADVVPVDGEVILSLHYQNGWRVSPDFVSMERDFEGEDPIAFMRLKLAKPAARLTLTWENR